MPSSSRVMMPAPASWASRWRRDGIEVGLLDTLLEAIGRVAEAEERSSADGDRAAGDTSLAQAMLAALLEPGFLERVRSAEERWLETLVPWGKAQPEVFGESMQWVEREWEGPPTATIMRAERHAPRIGVARIGDETRNIRVEQVQDSAALRATGAWRQLPVGCLVHAWDDEPVLATIGAAVILGDLPRDAKSELTHREPEVHSHQEVG